jgi:YHS domain-containing protein
MAHIQRAFLTIPAIRRWRGAQSVADLLARVEGIRTIGMTVPAEQVEVDYDDDDLVQIDRIEAILREESYPVAATRLHRRRSGRARNSDKENTAMTRTMAIDPVCGMSVDRQAARRTTQYNEQTYCFCSPGCKKAFDADPQPYASSEPRQRQDACCSCCSA